MNLYPRFHYSLLKKVQIAGENHTKTVYTLKVLVAILASPKHRAFTRSYRSNVESKSSLTVIEQGALRSSCTKPVAGFQSPGVGGALVKKFAEEMLLCCKIHSSILNEKPI